MAVEDRKFITYSISREPTFPFLRSIFSSYEKKVKWEKMLKIMTLQTILQKNHVCMYAHFTNMIVFFSFICSDGIASLELRRRRG